MFLASQTVQVTTEANTRPIMTACTRMSADMNIDQGERSRGSWAMPIAGSGAGPWSKARRGRRCRTRRRQRRRGLLRCRRLRLRRGRALGCCRRRIGRRRGSTLGESGRGRREQREQHQPREQARSPRRGAGEAQSPGSGTTCGIAILMTSVGLLRPAFGRGARAFSYTRAAFARPEGRTGPLPAAGPGSRPRRPPSNG